MENKAYIKTINQIEKGISNTSDCHKFYKYLKKKQFLNIHHLHMYGYKFTFGFYCIFDYIVML